MTHKKFGCSSSKLNFTPLKKEGWVVRIFCIDQKWQTQGLKFLPTIWNHLECQILYVTSVDVTNLMAIDYVNVADVLNLGAIDHLSKKEI